MLSDLSLLISIAESECWSVALIFVSLCLYDFVCLVSLWMSAFACLFWCLSLCVCVCVYLCNLCVSLFLLLSLPLSICGCGSGESGCSACGCCKACARELDGQEARQRGIFDAVKEMIPLDLLLGITHNNSCSIYITWPKWCGHLFVEHLIPKSWALIWNWSPRGS